jgi:proline dehydrogenase
MSLLDAGLRHGLLWASRSAALKRRLPRVPFVRRAVSRFMPGESPAEALAACEELRGRGIGTVVTLLGENVTGEHEARAVVTHYTGVLEEISRRGLGTEISVKPTHLGLDVSAGIAATSLGDLAACAASLGNDVWVDMEGSGYTQATLDLYRRTHAAHPNTGVCIQAYLRRTAADLGALLAAPVHAPRLRLVKGAYAEPAAVAFAKKAEVDASFMALATRMLDAAGGNGSRLVFGTHDLRAIRSICEAAAARGLAKSAFEFHMLYGIQRGEQERLAAEGYRVRVLISYGSEWFPWYMRRLAERPANLWFVARSVFAR